MTPPPSLLFVLLIALCNSTLVLFWVLSMMTEPHPKQHKHFPGMSSRWSHGMSRKALGHPKDSRKHAKSIPHGRKNQVSTGSHRHAMGYRRGHGSDLGETYPRQYTHVLRMFSRHCHGISRKSLRRPKKSGKYFQNILSVTWKRVLTGSHEHCIGLLGGNKKNTCFIPTLRLRLTKQQMKKRTVPTGFLVYS